jgi:hypothetical protein
MLKPVTCNRKLPNFRRTRSASAHRAACAASRLAYWIGIAGNWLVTPFPLREFAIEVALWLRRLDLSARERGSFKDFVGPKFWLAVAVLLRAKPDFLILPGTFRLGAARLRLSHIPGLISNPIVSA